MKVTTMTFLVFLACVLGSSCGYLDEDLLVDEVTFEEGFGIGGIGLSGYGTSSGCGGYGHYRSRVPSIGLASVSTVGASGLSATVTMTDAEILEGTDVEMIDETAEPSPSNANIVEQVYYSAMEDRDRALAQTY